MPGAPSSPNMHRALLISLALGLAAALGLAFVLERLDDTLRSPEEVERALGYATLGIIPKIGLGTSLEAELADPRSHMSEAYRSLCTALQLSTEKGLPKTMLVTSAGPGEGKSTTCLTLARHFANIGLKVLLVDADLRKPSLHTKLNLDNASGLSNYLTGAATPPELLQKTDLPNLAFMASGPLPPNAADLLGSSRLLSLLSVGLEVFDLIVVDSPPVMGLGRRAIVVERRCGDNFYRRRRSGANAAHSRCGQAAAIFARLAHRHRHHQVRRPQQLRLRLWLRLWLWLWRLWLWRQWPAAQIGRSRQPTRRRAKTDERAGGGMMSDKDGIENCHRSHACPLAGAAL